METKLYAPKKICVGYQKRKDTYTNMLAYIIYYDETGKLRKEVSWNQWRDKSIESQNFENVPTEGFVLNKDAGGYRTHFGYRGTRCRVYDPRGFEFEITIENLLYILDNCSSVKGKGLEGQFIYAWKGTELILIPTDSPDFEEIVKYTSIVENKNFVKPKDLVVGKTYCLKNETEDLIFLGKFKSRYDRNPKYESIQFFFGKLDSENKKSILSFNSLSKTKILGCTDESISANLNELLEYLHNRYTSERHLEYDAKISFTVDEIVEIYDNLVKRSKSKIGIERYGTYARTELMCNYKLEQNRYYYNNKQEYTKEKYEHAQEFSVDCGKDSWYYSPRVVKHEDKFILIENKNLDHKKLSENIIDTYEPFYIKIYDKNKNFLKTILNPLIPEHYTLWQN